MVSTLSVILLGLSTLTSALPVLDKRVVTALNQVAFAEAQKRDATATRAFSATEIKTSSGQCLFVDELSGDFRANLTPIQVAACDGSAGQKWDVLTSGIHNNQAGTMLVVSSLTQACFNFDPRRAAGNQVLLFSCGGRADGAGLVTDSQLFPFAGGAGPLTLSPKNAAGTCLTVKGKVIDQAACSASDANQSFTFGGAAVAVAPAAPAAPVAPIVAPVPASPAPAPLTPANTTTAPAATIVAPVPIAAAGSAIPVARAGSVLNPQAAAEANQRDATATRAFSSVSLKSASGQCLFIDPFAGDFRENLIPVQLKACDGSPNTKFDVITAGKHNNQPNSALFVSTATQGCLNFDPRRAANDQVIMFSCGGRADGAGLVTDSQLFKFSAGSSTVQLAPNSQKGATCLVANGAVLGSAACSNDNSQSFTIG